MPACWGTVTYRLPEFNNCGMVLPKANNPICLTAHSFPICRMADSTFLSQICGVQSPTVSRRTATPFSCCYVPFIHGDVSKLVGSSVDFITSIGCIIYCRY